MKINLDKFEKMLVEYKYSELKYFDTDFAASGGSSSLIHAKNLYAYFLQLMKDLENPFILGSRLSISYLIHNGLMSGLFGKINEIVEVGVLLENDKSYMVYNNTPVCLTCGAPKKNSICKFCGTGTKFTHNAPINIYAYPDFKEIMLIETTFLYLSDYELNKYSVIKLMNLSY